MISKISGVPIYVSDQRAAIDFYVNKVGFELVSDLPGGYGEGENTNWVEVAPPGAATVLTLTPPGLGVERGGGAFFATDDAEATAKTFRANGVEISREVEAAPWGIWFMFKDLDGNDFMVVQRQV